MDEYSIEPPLTRVQLDRLRPTQMTVGFKEVESKRREWAKLSAQKRDETAAVMLFPAVKGPQDRFYILDHHHAAVALFKEKVQEVQVGIVKDLSSLKQEAFWVFMDHAKWIHCYDAKGKRQPISEMPATFAKLKDDPYRSLVRDVQCAGGFAKPEEPVLEFLWVNYFRDRIAQKKLKGKPKQALREALALAQGKDTRYLPGWAGKTSASS